MLNSSVVSVKDNVIVKNNLEKKSDALQQERDKKDELYENVSFFLKVAAIS